MVHYFIPNNKCIWWSTCSHHTWSTIQLNPHQEVWILRYWMLQGMSDGLISAANIRDIKNMLLWETRAKNTSCSVARGDEGENFLACLSSGINFIGWSYRINTYNCFSVLLYIDDFFTKFATLVNSKFLLD